MRLFSIAGGAEESWSLIQVMGNICSFSLCRTSSVLMSKLCWAADGNGQPLLLSLRLRPIPPSFRVSHCARPLESGSSKTQTRYRRAAEYGRRSIVLDAYSSSTSASTVDTSILVSTWVAKPCSEVEGPPTTSLTPILNVHSMQTHTVRASHTDRRHRSVVQKSVYVSSSHPLFRCKVPNSVEFN